MLHLQSRPYSAIEIGLSFILLTFREPGKCGLVGKAGHERAGKPRKVNWQKVVVIVRRKIIVYSAS